MNRPFLADYLEYLFDLEVPLASRRFAISGSRMIDRYAAFRPLHHGFLPKHPPIDAPFGRVRRGWLWPLRDVHAYLSIFPKAWTDGKWAGDGLGLNRYDVMEVRVMGRRLPLEAWRVLHGKPIDPFRANG